GCRTRPRLPPPAATAFQRRLHRRRTGRQRGARRHRPGGRRGRRMTTLTSRLGYPLLGLVLLVAVWALACWLLGIPTVVLPSPDKVLHAMIARGDLLLGEGWVTLRETMYGFVLALAVGLPLAVAVANSRPLNLMFYPLLIALQSVPKVALAPIVLVWLGTGIEAKLPTALRV